MELYNDLLHRIDTFVKGAVDFERARAVVPFVYYALFFIAFTRLEGLDQFVKQSAAGFDPRWPLFWAHSFDLPTVVTIVYLGFTFSTLVASFFPYAMAARAVAFLGLLEFHAYMSSFGGPNHQWDHWLWVLFILVFLPPEKKTHTDEDARRRFSLVFWGAQAFILLTYTMAGINKVFYGIIQLVQGQPNAFSIDAGALHVAQELTNMGQSTLFGPFIVHHPVVAWLPFLAVLYIQLFAFAVAFKPRLHRLWGIGLVLFHIGTFLTMRAVFTAPSVLLLVLLCSSPFVPAKNPPVFQFFSLPVVAGTVKLFRRLRVSSTSTAE